jgi:hypothetical protein
MGGALVGDDSLRAPRALNLRPAGDAIRDMKVPRIALDSASVMVATLIVGACAQASEAVTGRDLECAGVPEHLCVQMADHKASSFERLNPTSGPIVRVAVSAHDCADGEPGAIRCWIVDAVTAAGARSAAVYVQRQDGTLVGPGGDLGGDRAPGRGAANPD